MKATLAIGSYTQPDSPGIRIVEVDAEVGAIRQTGLVDGIGNPIYFAVDRARRMAYATQGAGPAAGRADGGTLAAYRLGGAVPELVDSVKFDFSVPCHISLAADGGRLYFAEYSKAHAGAVALKADGTFDRSRIAVVRHEGRGPNQVRQEAAHCHCAIEAPGGGVLYVCDLGIDAVKAYAAASPGLDPMPELDFRCPPGYGPRHLLFAPDGRRAWLVYELASAVQAFSVSDDGSISPLQDPVSMLPSGFAGETKAAAIRLSPCGRWLLASNRGHDSIAAFRVAADGTLPEAPVISRLTGSFPRDFDFVAGTDCVAVCHKLSDELCLYRFDCASGVLSRLPGELKMARPLAIASISQDDAPSR